MSNEFPKNDNSELVVTGGQLNTYIDGLIAEGKATHAFFTSMARLLAERIEGGIVPLGYVMASELLIYDCKTGTNGFTGEPMPPELSGMSDVVYTLFRKKALDYAHDAFGDEFGGQVDQLYADVTALLDQ